MSEAANAEAVMVAELTACQFELVSACHGAGFYRNIYRCIDYPRLVIVKEGPRRPLTGTAMRRFLVDGKPVETIEAAAAALSAP